MDDADGVREPIGMSGVRLEVEVHIVTGAVTSVQNVVRAVNRAGLTVQDVVLEPIASAEAVLFPDEKELGVVLIDIGGGTTDMALFRDGAIWHTAIIPLGGDHITNDVAVGLRTPMADAEDLKKRYGCALTAMVPAEETVDVPVGGRAQAAPALAPGAVGDHPAARRGDHHAGGARADPRGLPGRGHRRHRGDGRHARSWRACPELAEAIFDQPVRRGVPGDIGGLADVVQQPDPRHRGGAGAARRPPADRRGRAVDPDDHAFLPASAGDWPGGSVKSSTARALRGMSDSRCCRDTQLDDEDTLRHPRRPRAMSRRNRERKS